MVGSAGGRYEVGAGRTGYAREDGGGEYGRRGERWQGGLYQLSAEGEPIKKFCYHISGQYCEEDRLLATILMLRVDEPRVLRDAYPHAFEDGEMRRVEARRVFRPRAA